MYFIETPKHSFLPAKKNSMNKKHLKTTVLPGLLVLSCNLFAQSQGGIGKQSLWLTGNFSSDSTRLRTLNFNSAMSIDNSNTIIKMPGIVENLRRVTIFTVYQNPVAAEEKRVWEMSGDWGDMLLSTQQVLSKSRKTNIVFAKNKSGSYQPDQPEAVINTYLSRRGVSEGTENSEPKENLIRFGDSNPAGSASTSAGLISEFMLYEKILNEEDIARIETYLALKYGITLEKNYLNARGKTVWNREKDKFYSNHIAGIARDDLSTLYQKQSTSYNNSEHLIIGVNKIVQSNSENNGEINNGDYLVWGDNGQPFTLNLIGEDGDGKIILPQKKWLMKCSGSNTNTISTELQIDTKPLVTQHFSKDSFCLIIDRSGSGEFSSENCTCVMPDSISSTGIAIFKNLFWNTDGSGKEFFTFGFKAQESKELKNSTATGVLLFQVYPNPVSDGHYKITVRLNKPMDVKVVISDANQKLVDSKKGNGGASYSFSGYIHAAAGAYTVKLITPETELSKVIILQ
jgi:hypothetical protein